MRISDWSSECALPISRAPEQARRFLAHHLPHRAAETLALGVIQHRELVQVRHAVHVGEDHRRAVVLADVGTQQRRALEVVAGQATAERRLDRSEEHTSELQSLMRISYAVFCLKKKNQTNTSKHKIQ